MFYEKICPTLIQNTTLLTSFHQEDSASGIFVLRLRIKFGPEDSNSLSDDEMLDDTDDSGIELDPAGGGV